jgi:hypothetical protein
MSFNDEKRKISCIVSKQSGLINQAMNKIPIKINKFFTKKSRYA